MNKDKFIIRGGNTLCGTLKVQTSKNATLPILTASLMSGGRVEIKDYPHIIDVENMCAILKALNVDVEKTFADKLTDKQYIIKNGGHINAETGYTKFEEILKEI
mgnify:CR=1 FL=1